MSRFVLRGPHHRSGQALVEFAIVAFVTTILFAAILSFGMLIFGANVLQQAADVGAQELSRFPYPPVRHASAPVEATPFEDALERSGLFDEKYLVCEIGGGSLTEEDLPVGYNNEDVANLLSRMPLINRLLFSVFIYDPDLNALRYPGTVLARSSDGERTIRIPVVETRHPETGVETISAWRRVVEEVLPEAATEGPYSLASPTPGSLDPGMVALRIHYPFQSGALVAVQYKDAGGTAILPRDAIGEDVVNWHIVASDDDVILNEPVPSGYSLVVANGAGVGAQAGAYGLGRQFAFTTNVRPYRKLISAQAIYRREVFE